MKKKLIATLLLATALTTTGCNIDSFLSAIMPEYSSSPDEINTSEDISSEIESTQEETESSAETDHSRIIRSFGDSSESSSSGSSSQTSSVADGDGYYFVEDLTKDVTYRDLNLNQGYDVLPASGDVKLLVLMIEFTDSPFNSSVETDLENALNGNGAEDTGYWESVSSYYNKSSHGKINLSYEIAPVYNTGISYKEFVYTCNKNYESAGFYDVGSYGSNVMCENAIENYKETVGNTKAFDADGNGLIDGIIMVYSCHNSYDYPVSYTKSGKTYKDEGDLYWAFCYWDMYTEQYNPSNPNPFLFFWMSYDFLYEAVSSPKVDAHTLIHESGHMFGLDDYYGNEEYGSFVTGTMSMMDYNIMDLDAFSKVALGWSSAYVVEDSCTINLKPMTSDSQVIIVAPSNNGTTQFNNTPFDEYLLIELYTPDGLNYLDSHTKYSSRRQGFSKAGIRLWHVDARLVAQNCSTYDISYIDSFNANDNNNWQFVGASNTYKVDGVDEDFNLLTLIDQAGKVYTESDPYSNNNSLFQTGDKFTWNTYKKYFPKTTKLNNGKTFNFTINFDSVSETGATISFVRG